MSKLNIIIDGNYHMHRSLHAYEAVSETKLDNSDDCARFIRKLATDVAYAIKQVGTPSRLIWTIDNNSWRKKVEIDQNDGYKKNRNYGNEVNWKNFKELNIEFGKILERHGCICSNIDGFEGDDLMYFWSEKLYNDGEDVILITGDHDINQLVKCNGQNFVCVFNDNSQNRKLIAANGFIDYINSEDVIDMFNMDAMANNKSLMLEMIKNIPCEEINPENIIYEKIVSGDSGDNVPPIVTWTETQSSGKTINRKITEKKAAIIKESLLEKYNSVDVTNLSQYALDFSSKIKEVLKQDVNAALLKERLERNTKLVWLNKNVMPEELSVSFAQHLIETEKTGHPNVNVWKMQSLLEGTEYYTEEKMIEMQSDYFKEAPKKKSKGPSVDDLYKTLF